jgi:hypothetical protein
MFGWADANWLRVCGYLVVAGLCFLAIRREDPDSPGSWPPFWLLTGGLLVVMAIGRAGDIADLVTDAMRDRAVEGGWYESRRRFQGLIVAALGLTWFILVMTACWRVPARRRRYLPMIVVVLTIGFYAAVRIVSLHQIDWLLHRREISGARFGTIVELTLLAVAAGCAIWTPRRKLGVDRSDRTDAVAVG